MNMTEILFMNIDSFWTKEWDNFLSLIELMMVCDNANAVTSVLDGNVFFVERALSTNKGNIFSIIDWKSMFLFNSWPLDR